MEISLARGALSHPASPCWERGLRTEGAPGQQRARDSNADPNTTRGAEGVILHGVAQPLCLSLSGIGLKL